MTCNELLAEIGAYADGEIDRMRSRSVERHLRDCPACAARHQAILALRARIKDQVPKFQAPPALRERILARSSQASDGPRAASRPDRQRFAWLTGGVVAGCTATILAWLVGTAVIDRRATDDMATEAVTTHVRATLNNHLIEVASSDQHTVKPWLSARLDYSPPVHDFADEGFPLLGGRVDTLGGRHVAALVYRYRQHTIDVFVSPDETHWPTKGRTVRGFNVARVVGSGMDWVVVSDVSAEVLAAFAQRLAQESAVQ